MILEELLYENVIGSPTYVIRKKALESLKYPFNGDFHIIGDYDIYTRLAIKWKFSCVQIPIAYARIHGQNESLLNRNKEIDEMKVWYNAVKKNPTFSLLSGLNQIPLRISYLETMQVILKDRFIKSFLMVIRYPFCSNKIKLLIALLLPKFVLKKIKNY